jgi:hypothetical protein
MPPPHFRGEVLLSTPVWRIKVQRRAVTFSRENFPWAIRRHDLCGSSGLRFSAARARAAGVGRRRPPASSRARPAPGAIAAGLGLLDIVPARTGGRAGTGRVIIALPEIYTGRDSAPSPPGSTSTPKTLPQTRMTGRSPGRLLLREPGRDGSQNFRWRTPDPAAGGCERLVRRLNHVMLGCQSPSGARPQRGAAVTPSLGRHHHLGLIRHLTEEVEVGANLRPAWSWFVTIPPRPPS